MIGFQVLCLAGLFLLNFLGNGTIPLPVTAYVVWLGWQFDMPIPVILVGTLGTVLGWLVIGTKVSKLVREKAPERLIRTIPELYRRLFLQYPGLSVFLFNALPFPFDMTRLLAIVYGIDPMRLVLPLALGRIVRYSLLLYAGDWMAGHLDHFAEMAWVLLALILLPLIVKLLRREEPQVEAPAIASSPVKIAPLR